MTAWCEYYLLWELYTKPILQLEQMRKSEDWQNQYSTPTFLRNTWKHTVEMLQSCSLKQMTWDKAILHSCNLQQYPW